MQTNLKAFEVFVNRLPVSKRGFLVAAVLCSGLSLAQARPGNDACSGAVQLAPAAGTVVSSPSINISGADPGVESTFACGGTTPSRSVWYTFTTTVAGSYTINNCALSNFDSVLQVYTGTCGGLTQVATACNDDASATTGGCSPQSGVTLTLTATTTYYVQVAGYGSTTVGATSTAGINIIAPSLPLTNDLCAAAEAVVPNGGTTVLSTIARTFAAANAAEEPFACLTTPTSANHSVWYSVTPTTTGLYRLETCGAVALGNTVADTVLGLYEGTCGALTSTATTCNNDSCGTRSSLLATLTAGTTYYVQLAKTGLTAPVATADSLQLAVTQVITGPADLCSASSPELNLNQTALVTTRSPDAGLTAALNNAQLGDAGCFVGAGNSTTNLAPGRDVAYQFRSVNAGLYSFRVGSPSVTVDSVLYLSDSCVPTPAQTFSSYGPPQCIAANNRNSSAQEQVSCVPLTANQTVFVWVDETSLSTAGSDLALEVSPCNPEGASNNTPATASALSCVTTGSINPAGDVDYYALGAPPAGSRIFAMAEAAAASSTDFDMRVTTDIKTLEYDDIGLSALFGDSAPLIAGAIAPGGPTYVRMNHFSASTVAEPYVVYTAIQTGAPTVEVEPNQDIATATTGSRLYFQGDMIFDGGTDVDVYSFTANAGDIVFAALDSVLDKADAGVGTFNYALTLIDSTNALVLRADDTSTTTTLTPNDGGLTASTPTFPGEGLTYRIRTTGTYGIRVDKTSGVRTNPYLLSISVGCRDLSPTLTLVNPSSGTPGGGQLVTLTGSNFSERSVVRFGATIAQVVTISPTELVISTSPNSSGDVDVSVTNGVGLVATLSPGYTFDDPPGLPPVLGSLSPLVGPVTGGTVVTLTGTVFRRDAGVFFDVGGASVGAASVTVSNATRVLATTPPQAEGAASVTIINPDGLTSTLTNGFTFEGPPSVTSVTPSTGLTTGGQTITIAGRNFRAGTTVRVGATLATAVTPAVDGLSLTAVTPVAALSGVVDVIVRTTDTQTTTVTGGFTYLYPAPSITVVTPASGYAVGGQPITVTGTNFITGPTLTIGGTAATNVVRTSSTQITATTPAGTPGPADVVVTNSDLQAATRAAGFRYVPAPTLAAVSPANGQVQGGTRITLTGTNFTQGASIFIGGVPAFAVQVASDTSATAVTNVGAPGLADVRLTNPDLQSATLMAAFNYDAAPTLTALSPISGSTAGGTTVTLTGSGFLSGAAVVFGTSEAATVTVVSPTELTAVTPARAVGVVSVVVRNTDSQSAELLRAYRFVAPPTFTAAAPSTGDVTGGTVVRLTGTGFSAGTTVTFGGTASQQVTLVSGTELDAVTPAHAPGATDIVVSTDGATATLTGGFTYTRGAPTLTAAAPVSGPIAGGTLLTLTGTGFAAGATVTIGGAAGTDLVIVSGELARVVVPAHAAGAVDVVLTNDDAQKATLAGAYTYVAPPTSAVGTLTDGGSGAVGEDPTPLDTNPGGVSCGCTSFDGSVLSLGGMGLLLVLSRRRRQ